MRISSIIYYFQQKDLVVDFLSALTDGLHPFHTFVIEQIDVGIHAIDQEGKTVIYNEKMKAIEGLALTDIQDRSIVELFNFNQQESTLLKVLQSGKSLLNIKQTYWNRNGVQITTINDTYPIFQEDHIIGAVEIAKDITAVEKLMHQPIQQQTDLANFGQLIATSTAMQIVISTAKKAAAAKLPVLLVGETGTGKDILAQCIHNKIEPKQQQFYTLNCQSADQISIERMQSLLKTDQACTLFCERIDLLSLPLQQLLVDSLQNMDAQHIVFIGSIGEDPVDLIAKGILLKELYYFFASFTIPIPPLRKRKSDILPFVNQYLDIQNKRYHNSLQQVSPEVKTIFRDYRWPGNMRELEFLLNEISSLTTTETTITYDMLPHYFRLKATEAAKDTTGGKDFIVHSEKDLVSLDQYLKEAEAYYVEKALKLNKHNITKTAKALGMSRQSLQYRLKKLKDDK